MPGPLQGFVNGFQTQLTANVLIGDTDISFPTAGLVAGLKYQIRIDDSNPPTTYEFCEVQFKDTGTVSCVNGGAGRGFGGTSAQAHTSGPSSGFVTAILLKEGLLPTFARLDTQNLMAFASASGISGQFFNVYGLTGATSPTRYVGATTGGAPASGTFLTGDFVLDTSNSVIWICTAGGSPGTWINVLDGTNTGLAAGVSSLTRWIGATATGAPLTGTWKIGDVITDRTGKIWMCTVPGTPGTWAPIGPVRLDPVMGTNTATFTLPTGYSYRKAQIDFAVRDTGAGTTWQYLIANFNGDVGANYDNEIGFFFGATTQVPFEGLGETFARIGACMQGANANANLYAMGSFEIFMPFATFCEKQYTGDTSNKYAQTTGTVRQYQFSGGWRSAAAITSIVVKAAGGDNFNANSDLRCWLFP